MQNQTSSAPVQQEAVTLQTDYQQRPSSRQSSSTSSFHFPAPPNLRGTKAAEQLEASVYQRDHDEDYNNQQRRSSQQPLKRKPVATRDSTGGDPRTSSALSDGRRVQDPSLQASLSQDPDEFNTADHPGEQRGLGSTTQHNEHLSTLSPSTAHARNSSDPATSEHQPSPLSRMTTANQLQRSNSDRLEIQTIEPNKQQASSKISSFFGWRGGNASSSSAAVTPVTPIADSSPTTISSDSDHSPYVRSPITFASSVKSVPPQIDVSKANSAGAPTMLSANFTAPLTPAMNVQLDEMEEELRDLSSELAASIRREMELEDEVERLQNGGDRGRRTSDYFSDSAASSVKDSAISSGRTTEEELDRLKRSTQQEKAQLKLELAQKLEQERGKRKSLEEHVQTLQNHISELEKNGAPQGDRTQELERRLAEEREMKQNYEDLLNALKGDLSRHQSERDNLRDEVVPQLRARVDGLEAEVAQYATMEYEHSKMQQELQAAKSSGLSRGQSVRKTGLSRSSSIKGSSLMAESKENLAERVKDSEAQRDALHKALKNLLERQKVHQKAFEKRVRFLEAERDAAIDASSPVRRAYVSKVKDLRWEVNTLRSRAEDAIESKWQAEKNLAGLKMNLDRAELETASLRDLLKQNDILVPDMLPGQTADNSSDATSATLERAYRELREAQSSSISQLKQVTGLDGETSAALDALLSSLEETGSGGNSFGLQTTPPLLAQGSSSEVHSFDEVQNSSLSTQLEAGAARIKLLSAEVQRQLVSNNGLRERLGYAVSKGEREQRTNADRITTLQSRLRSLEDKLVQAQSDSEDKVMENEDIVRNMTKSDNPLVKRVNRVGRSPALGGNSGSVGGVASAPRSPIMPSTPGIKTPLGPKIGAGQSLSDAMRTEYLEDKVAELEKALAETDKEMQEVVQRMNMAQIEVLELQSQRDDAVKQTRSLQDKIQQENANMGGLMARMVGK